MTNRENSIWVRYHFLRLWCCCQCMYDMIVLTCAVLCNTSYWFKPVSAVLSVDVCCRRGELWIKATTHISLCVYERRRKQMPRQQSAAPCQGALWWHRCGGGARSGVYLSIYLIKGSWSHVIILILRNTCASPHLQQNNQTLHCLYPQHYYTFTRFGIFTHTAVVPWLKASWLAECSIVIGLMFGSLQSLEFTCAFIGPAFRYDTVTQFVSLSVVWCWQKITNIVLQPKRGLFGDNKDGIMRKRRGSFIESSDLACEMYLYSIFANNKPVHIE